ncbi:MAG: sigma-70 family RNA polymerase sigma factor [Oscillospiraceae bacterium]|nr:sigma-70 family RNA polymerase sigma factor [Oscillospiraceae bacterium]
MNQQEVNNAFYAAQSGDNDAFTKIFDAYWDMAYYNCLKRLRNTQDAEDAVQEVFIILYRRIARMKGPEYLAKGIQYYALEVCSGYYNKSKQVPSDMITPLDELHNEPPAYKEEFLPQSVLERKELKEEILELVNNLPNRQREVLFNYYFNDFTTAEIAKMLNISVNAVGNCLFKARKKLSELVEKRTDSKELLLSTAVPILTLLFREEMGRLSLPIVRDRLIAGLGERLLVEKALGGQIAQTLSSNAQNISKGLQLTSKVKVAMVAAAACSGIVFGIYKLTNTEEVPYIPPTLISQNISIATIPPKIEPISFVSSSHSVTVKYYLDTMDEAGYMGVENDHIVENLTIGSTYTLPNDVRGLHLPEGYIYLASNEDNLQVSESDNEIHVLYGRRSDLTVTIKYYKDTINDSGYMGSAYDFTIGAQTYGSSYTLSNSYRDRNAPEGYSFDRTDVPMGTVMITLGTNEIRVLYTKRGDLNVTVKYYLDTFDDAGYMGQVNDEIIGGLAYGSIYTISDELRIKHLPEGYRFATMDHTTGSVDVNLGENEIKVLYTKRDDLVVTIKYYQDSISDSGYMGSTYDVAVGNLTYGNVYEIPMDIRNRHLSEGYQYGGMDAQTGSVIVSLGSNEVKVLYTKRNDLNITIKYYKDTMDESGYLGTAYDQIIGGLSYGSSYALDNSFRDLFLPEGYRFGRTDSSNGTIIVGQSDNVIRVLYNKIGDLDTARVTYFSSSLQGSGEENMKFTVHITLADGRSFTVDHFEKVDERSKGNKFFLYDTAYGSYTVYVAWDDNSIVTSCEIREFVPVF